jgi:hypothetical protein
MIFLMKQTIFISNIRLKITFEPELDLRDN